MIRILPCIPTREGMQGCLGHRPAADRQAHDATIWSWASAEGCERQRREVTSRWWASFRTHAFVNQRQNAQIQL